MTLSQSALLKKNREARYNARIKRTLDELVPISEKITLLVHASANRAALKGLKTGMRLEEAKRSMGDRTRTGSSGYFTNIVLKNPHRSMTFYGKKGERIEAEIRRQVVSSWPSESTRASSSSTRRRATSRSFLSTPRRARSASPPAKRS